MRGQPPGHRLADDHDAFTTAFKLFLSFPSIAKLQVYGVFRGLLSRVPLPLRFLAFLCFSFFFLGRVAPPIFAFSMIVEGLELLSIT